MAVSPGKGWEVFRCAGSVVDVEAEVVLASARAWAKIIGRGSGAGVSGGSHRLCG